MCDQDHLADMDERGDKRTSAKGMNRREFAAMGAVATLIACTPMDDVDAAGGATEETVKFDAAGGRMDAFFAHPVEGKHPAVVVWPDIAGVRDAFMSMSRRLASEGYAVLVLNPYFQDKEAPQFEDFDDWRTQGGMEKVGPWRAKLTPEAVAETAKAVVAFLDKQDSVDTSKGVGVQGYCMGGPLAVWTAAAVPERVKAVATFHGGGLVGEDATSPSKMLGQTQASFLFAIARDDDKKAPGDKDALKAAAAAAGRPAEIKVYPADHGWTVVDSPVYDYDQDDASWARLLNLYKTAL
ncbi:dienelactone hydrolase family protein [Croceibacterium sp. LX-88]|uniref:Dienelactone hydrolase family protein n=1 Tax=Croceibacterium selenioxidans TaxID=2838833 RepID=A0ABS5W643_9SPHN|nr:dienelactone hydrolase family protein [Croceibacterium selenioxidans]MBT2134773.1 dienelactone hydrolase family protein [Croceibacterium selenioxidans]